MGRGAGPRQREMLAEVTAGRPFPLHGKDKTETSNLRKSAAALAARGLVEVVRVPDARSGELVYAVPPGFVWPGDHIAVPAVQVGGLSAL